MLKVKEEGLRRFMKEVNQNEQKMTYDIRVLNKETVLLNETIKKRHEGLALYMKDAWDREHALRSLLDIKLERFAEYQALKGAGLANVARSLGAQS
mmetsp:Transcript_7997/g.15179  ORF Transcript_7997/g.15179 Transcript_7997/m.15179 type:complete len:96 (-) Transcript_7997:45-332(-)